MILALGSSIYLLFGKDFVKALVFPLFYLTLMIPFPYVVTKELVYNLRLFDSAYSVAALKIIGIPFYRDSYFLHLPNITLEVADGCSGVASIFALFAVALVYAYFSPVSWTTKLLAAASVVPIAILANLFRIILIATLAYYLGPVALNSPIHYWSGVFNFVVGLTFLVLVGELVRKRFSKYASRTSHRQIREPTVGVWVGWRTFIVGVSIFGLALWFSGNLGAGAKASVKINLEELSSSIAQLYPQTHLLWVDPYEDNKADSHSERSMLALRKFRLSFSSHIAVFTNRGESLTVTQARIPRRLEFCVGQTDGNRNRRYWQNQRQLDAYA
jgi:exosortase